MIYLISLSDLKATSLTRRENGQGVQVTPYMGFSSRFFSYFMHRDPVSWLEAYCVIRYLSLKALATFEPVKMLPRRRYELLSGVRRFRKVPLVDE